MNNYGIEHIFRIKSIEAPRKSNTLGAANNNFLLLIDVSSGNLTAYPLRDWMCQLIGDEGQSSSRNTDYSITEKI
jgi:hypothetical protein